MQSKEINICPWCYRQTTLVWVHGHGQCTNCWINIDECRRGEQCDQDIIYPEAGEMNDE
jgi:hypothetical protein